MRSTLVAPTRYMGVFRTDDDARAVYAEAAGIGRIVPLAVAVPSSSDDVAALVQWASDEGHPIIARGSGSSMAGGAIGDGIVVDLSRLRELDDADVEGRRIRAASGVLRAEVQRRAEKHRLRFAVDPSSGEFCTIGGMAATNAAGPHSLRHGAMRPWVLALECVFADGSRATIRRGSPAPLNIAPVRRFMQTVHPQLLEPRRGGSSVDRVLKNSSGYAIDAYGQTQELVDLLVGSEGTLALFTGVEIALTPAPAAAASMFVAFRDLEHAVEAAVAARGAPSVAACELLDRTFLTLAAEAGRPLPAPAESEAALLLDVEGLSSSHAIEEVERLRDRFRSMGAVDAIVAVGSSHEAELWMLRHAASPAIAKLDPALRSMQFIEDAAVPPSSLAAYVRGVRTILSRYDTRGVIFGHAGDAHVHVNPLVDTRRPDWRDRLEGILVAVTDLVADLGGTLTGEHGDGRLRTPLMDRVWRSGERRLFAATKVAFDPSNALNPGVKVPLPGQRAVDVIKYDPRLKQLPHRAAAALATVERERAYARHRLDLLL